MGGDDSQKLLPWRGIYSSPGRSNLRLKYYQDFIAGPPPECVC
jgi:hypothetical protein